MKSFLGGLILLLGAIAIAPVSAQDFGAVLRDGGLVIAMRHASSPREEPTEEEAARRNVNLERELDETGISDSEAMGESWRTAAIHISEVFSSPAFRAVQTSRSAGYLSPQIRVELDGASAGTDEGVRWMRTMAGRRVVVGNRLIITHAGNLSAAFGEEARGMIPGEALLIQPQRDGFTILGRVGINAWPELVLTP